MCGAKARDRQIFEMVAQRGAAGPGVDPCRRMRPKLFGKAPLEFADESRRILQIAMRPKLQIAFYQVK